MVMPCSSPLSLDQEPVSPLNSDDLESLLLDFDPINEWLIDPDFLMSGDDAKVLDSVALQSNKIESYGAGDQDGPTSEMSNFVEKGELLFSSIDEKLKSVTLIEEPDEKVNDVVVFAKMASMDNDKKTTVQCSIDHSEVATVSSGATGSEESDMANGLGVMEASGTGNACVTSLSNESDDEGSGTESDESEEEDTDSESEDSSSSSSSSEEENGKDGHQHVDDSDTEFHNNFGGGSEIGAEGEIEEGEIRDIDPEEMIFGSEDDEDVVKGPIKSINEIENLPPVPKIDATLEPHHQTLPVGVISAILDNKVIVEGSEKHSPLNEGSILWITEMRLPLGLVDEIFGPVKNPFYIVRYNSSKEVPTGIRMGTAVSFVPEFASYILNHNELCRKAYDASGENDEELGEEVEFSDDEKETEYKKSLRLSKRGNNDRRKGNETSSFIKKRNFKGATMQKDKPLSVDHVPELSAQPSISISGPTPPPGLSSFGCTNYGSIGAGNTCVRSPSALPAAPLMAQMNSTLGLLPQQLQQQLNGFWLQGFPNQQQQLLGMQGLAVNLLSGQQLGDQTQFQHRLPQTHAFDSFPNRMPFHQLVPNFQSPASIPWFGGQINPSITSLGPMWNGNFGQHTSGNLQEQGATSFNEQNFGRPPPPPPPSAQGGARPPRQVSRGRGRASFRGRKPHRGGYHSYGRGDQQHNR
ncbi:H/ACA ribonucleoprotein complex non-core subunit NAF1-like [Canna indica]|uniref:H/ACA ribonucleoprotein complex non-core subunit NAF1 n=1 Tax=Canna indica TaxID=4628 RepID=A0AAQ3QKX0_9LILI|nr:H/ACA ribonucleoprotein complex non-core subunit NAF1-like [Canna indica]